MDTSLPLVWSSTFHGGARAPDEKFSQQLGAVVSMPFVSPRLSYNENSLWVRHVSERKAMWAFVHSLKDKPSSCRGTPA